jgi:hypothetical protein
MELPQCRSFSWSRPSWREARPCWSSYQATRNGRATIIRGYFLPRGWPQPVGLLEPKLYFAQSCLGSWVESRKCASHNSRRRCRRLGVTLLLKLMGDRTERCHPSARQGAVAQASARHRSRKPYFNRFMDNNSYLWCLSIMSIASFEACFGWGGSYAEP